MPYKYNLSRTFCNAGANYTIEDAARILELTHDRNLKHIGEWCEMSNNNVTPLPTSPLVVLPEITTSCVTGYECYHRRYWTDIISPTAPAHPYFRPSGMMQVFSLRLSTTPSRPVKIYGHFSVRDCWEPLRNHLFQRSRDDPATILQGCSLLPFCGPSRGIYVLQYILLDIALWIKEEGDGSADKPMFHGYIELNASLTGFDRKLEGRIHGNCHNLDMYFSFLSNSIESFLEIFADSEKTSKVKINALISGCEHEIALYDGTFCGTGTMVRHMLAVKLLGQLHIVLKLDGSLYSWNFQAGVGVLNAPKHSIPNFRTKGKASSTWQWSSIGNDVQLVEIRL